jgi:hypothetical protein
MATPFLGLALPVTGSLSGTWGTTVNNSITSLLDSAVAGTTTLTTNLDVILDATDEVTNTARQAILLCTGARTALRTITAPYRSKTYIVINITTGGQSVQVVGTGPTTGVTIANGEAAVIAWKGTDFVKVGGATVAGTDNVGYLNIPQNSQSANYTLVLADSGKHIFHPSTDANARTYTIPANSSVAYPIGTAISFINMTTQVVTIAITTDTMYLAAAGTTGSRSLAIYGSATAIKMTSTTWLISGSGLT